jgi:transcriptional regulator with XRE-family HTH domain
MAHFRLKDVAERERWSARRISRDSGLSYTAVQGVWSNRAKRVNLDTLQRLADTIGVSVRELIDDGKDEGGG